MKNTKLSREENVAKGYAVINPNGIYRRPPAMNQEMRDKVDSGYVQVNAWGKIELTDKYDLEINAIQKPTLKNPLFTGDQVDIMFGSILLQDMQELKSQMVAQFPESVNSVVYLIDKKPVKLAAMEAKLNRMFNNYWTPERKAIAKNNQHMQYAYEVAVLKLEQAKSNTLAKIAKADSYLQNAIERKNNPELAKSQNKIAAIIEDKKRSSSQKVEAIFDGNKSAGASHNAKRTIVLAIAKFLGKGFDKDSIFAEIAKMDEFSALSYKRPEKEFSRIFNDTTSWIHHKNQIKVFYDLLGWISEGMNNTKIRTKTKDLFYVLMTMVALHQAKDNDSRGLVAFRYLSRITVVSQKSLELDPRSLGEKFSAYAKLGYINYEKGIQGGISSRAGLKPYTSELSLEDAIKAKEAILNIFQDSPFYAELEAVLNLVTRITVVSQKSLATPAYNDSDFENAVEALLNIFVPMTRVAADERIAERQIESVDFEAAKENYLAEQEERIKVHLESGLGLQSRKKVFLAP